MERIWYLRGSQGVGAGAGVGEAGAGGRRRRLPKHTTQAVESTSRAQASESTQGTGRHRAAQGGSTDEGSMYLMSASLKYRFISAFIQGPTSCGGGGGGGGGGGAAAGGGWVGGYRLASEGTAQTAGWRRGVHATGRLPRAAGQPARQGSTSQPAHPPTHPPAPAPAHLEYGIAAGVSLEVVAAQDVLPRALCHAHHRVPLVRQHLLQVRKHARLAGQLEGHLGDQALRARRGVWAPGGGRL